jgi:hypothetical protein
VVRQLRRSHRERRHLVQRRKPVSTDNIANASAKGLELGANFVAVGLSARVAYIPRYGSAERGQLPSPIAPSQMQSAIR